MKIILHPRYYMHQQNASATAQKLISQQLLLDNEAVYEELLLNRRDIVEEGNYFNGEEQSLEEEKEQKESKLSLLQRATGGSRYALASIAEIRIRAVAKLGIIFQKI